MGRQSCKNQAMAIREHVEKVSKGRRIVLLATSCLALTLSAVYRIDVQQGPAGGDIPKAFSVPHDNYDYDKREVMIPMRAGVKLFTVIMAPKGVSETPRFCANEHLCKYPIAARHPQVERDYASIPTTLPSSTDCPAFGLRDGTAFSSPLDMAF
jgi:predicted acyl esterase